MIGVSRISAQTNARQTRGFIVRIPARSRSRAAISLRGSRTRIIATLSQIGSASFAFDSHIIQRHIAHTKACFRKAVIRRGRRRLRFGVQRAAWLSPLCHQRVASRRRSSSTAKSRPTPAALPIPDSKQDRPQGCSSTMRESIGLILKLPAEISPGGPCTSEFPPIFRPRLPPMADQAQPDSWVTTLVNPRTATRAKTTVYLTVARLWRTLGLQER